MRLFWERFRAALLPGTAALLMAMLTVALAAEVGKRTHAFDLNQLLALTGPDFWRGQYWRIITYALLPGGIIGFLTHAFVLVMLGSQLEREWSREHFWLYCAVCVAGAGLVKVLLASASPPPLAGAAPLMLGLLVGWSFVSANNSVPIPIFGQIPARWAALAIMGASFLTALFCGGLAAALITCSGGLAGWVYLWLRQKWLMTRPSRVTPSERISRLEL
jgi:membrane associated rhomboid family serine protease